MSTSNDENPFQFSATLDETPRVVDATYGTSKTSVLAVFTFVGGVSCFFGSCCFWYCSFPVSVAVLVMGVIGIKKIGASNGQLSGAVLCWFGIAFAVISLLISGTLVLFVVAALLSNPPALG